MSSITITSDLGTKDYYAAALQGALLSEVGAGGSIISISHHIPSYDITAAAYALRNSFAFFPPKTIHIVHVKTAYKDNPVFLVTKFKEHYFIAPDNGVLSLIVGDENPTVYKVDHFDIPTSPTVKVFASIASYIVSERPLIEIGAEYPDYERKIFLQPIISGKMIKGTVMHIDSFDNIVLNVTRKLFDRVGEGAPFEIFFRKHGPITRISDSYASVPVGNVLCRFNSAGFLEMAANMSRLATLFGIKPNDIIQIKFKK